MSIVQVVLSIVQTLQILLANLNLFTSTSHYYPTPASVQDGQIFDFIIVGAGTVGCVLANRLTEEGWSVALVEAGDYPTIAGDNPGFLTLEDTSPADWNYTSVNDGRISQSHKTCNIHESRGKVVGGSSVLNYMFYVRGNKADFDSWVAQGNEGWDWDNVTYYYKKSERLNDNELLRGPSAQLRSTEGYLGVSRPRFNKEVNPYLEVLRENGRNIPLDINGYNQIGYSIPQYTIDNGIRQSTAVSYIRPIKDRCNLFVLTNTLAKKVIINSNRVAIGVEVKLRNGRIVNLFANLEVILSAGTIDSPKLLMLSGVGPQKHLDEMNIPVVLNSPLIGYTMQDHAISTLLLYGKRDCLPNSGNSVVHSLKFPGPCILGHIALNRRQTYPDYQAQVNLISKGALSPTITCTHITKLQNEICEAVARASQERDVINVILSKLHPRSRGIVKLRSKNPEDQPLIFLNYFTQLLDLEDQVSYIEDFLTILNTY